MLSAKPQRTAKHAKDRLGSTFERVGFRVIMNGTEELISGRNKRIWRRTRR